MIEQKELLEAATRGDSTEVARLLAAHDDRPHYDSRWSAPLVEAARGGHAAVVRTLLDMTDASEDVLTGAASSAASGGFADLVIEIVSRGARADEALRTAAEEGATDLVKRLLATATVDDDAKSSALHEAVAKGHADAVLALIDGGADVSARDYQGWSVLAAAAAHGHGGIVELLEARGASKRGLLWAAAQRGQRPLAEKALADGEELSLPTEAGRTALHFAAGAGHQELIAFLLDRGADITAEDREGKTAAAIAAVEGQLEALKLLAERGASLDRALVTAAQGGHTAVVELCLSNGADIDARDEYVETALHKAAERGHAEIIGLLLARRPKVDRRNINGWTPLMRAAGDGHKEAVQQLLRAGANVNAKTEYGEETPLSWAAGRGHLEVVDLLLKSGAQMVRKGRYRPLACAARDGHVAVVERLCDAGAALEDEDDGTTALGSAAAAGHANVVDALLARGATAVESAVTLAAERGHAAIVERLVAAGASLPEDFLMKAAEGGQASVVELALKRGDRVDARGGYWDRTPLLAAAAAGSLEAVRLLLDAGADPKTRDKEGKSAVRLAEDRGARDVVKLLVSKGALAEKKEIFALAEAGDAAGVRALLAERANPDILGELRRTPMHEAAALGHDEIVTALLQNGASPNAVDEDGWTPLMEACDFGHLRVAELLLDANADPFRQDNRSFTAFTLAERRGASAVVALFREREVDRDWRPDLFQAAREGDLETLERLRKKGRPLDIREHDRYGIVHLAAQAGQLEVVRFGITHGLPFDQADESGATPLYAAATYNHAGVVRELLRAGAKAHVVDKYGGPAIGSAAGSGYTEVVEALAEGGADLDATDSEGRSALDKALQYEQEAAALALVTRGAKTADDTLERAIGRAPRVVKELVRRGSKLPAHASGARSLAPELWAEGIDAAFDDPAAALVQAAAYDEIDVVRALLEHGLDPNAPDQEGDTPLLRARSRDDKPLQKLLKKHGAKPRGLVLELAKSGETLTAKAIKAALTEGDALEIADGDGKTALHHAAGKGDADSVKALIAAKAPLDLLTKAGETPLLLALEEGNDDVGEALLDAGASVSAGGPDVWSAAAHFLGKKQIDKAKKAVEKGASTRFLMHAAASSGDVAAVALAEALGASAAFVEVKGWTVARYAAKSGSREVLDKVLALGSPKDGILHGAVASEDPEMVRWVLSTAGIDVNAKDHWDRAPLHEAGFEKAPIAALLLDAGADPNITDGDGWTPIFYAADNNNIAVIKLLLSRGANVSHANARGETVADRARWGDAEVKRALGLEETNRWGGYGGFDDEDGGDDDGNDEDGSDESSDGDE